MGVCSDETVRKNSISNLEEDFEKRYPLPHGYNSNFDYTEMINKFISDNQNDIQESFFAKYTNDSTFESLKQEEKQILINYLNSKKLTFLNELENKIRELENVQRDYNQVCTNILNIENAKQVYKQKILREISKINNNKDSFRIDFLTIMLVG